MPARLQLQGQRFGRLVAIRDIGHGTSGCRLWLCRCDCGEEAQVVTSSLRRGLTKSCGCLARELSAVRLSGVSTTHGMCDGPEYQSWKRMKARCLNPNDCGYDYYGGRGIAVCSEWLDSFGSFFEDMGARPPKTSLDRIDNNGPYSPDNCRWATRAEQQRNTRQNHNLTHEGRTMCLAAWAEETGLNYVTLAARIYRGWSVERALTNALVDYDA